MNVEKSKTPIPSFPTLKARGERVTMITVYDYPFARLVEGTTAELILVGDSLGMVIQGLEHTNPVTLDEIKQDPRLGDMVLVKNSRLSVQPVTSEEWRILCDMAGVAP